MALVQAERVAASLRDLGVETTLVTMTTSGDKWQGALATLGGKGAFVREIDRALLDNEIDIAVHCLKDIPGDQSFPAGLAVAAYPGREAVDDALVIRAADASVVKGLEDVPTGAVVGTSSVRRRAQLARLRGDLEIRPVRGNANTRLAKLDAGEYDFLVLAVAGLERLDADDRITAVLPIEQMLPAIGAGVIAIVSREEDEDARAAVAQLDDWSTRQLALAERSVLFALAGHCQSPIAGLAVMEDNGWMCLKTVVFSPDGATCIEATDRGAADRPADLGRAVAETLLRKGAREIIDAIPR